MLQLRAVSKGYFGHSRVLENVNLDLGKGEFLYVLGGSGAGKTTFLRMLATEEAPTSGHISLFGYDLSRASPAALTAIRRSISVIPQDVRLIPDLTVEDNVALALRLAGQKFLTAEIKRRIQETLAALGLGSKRDTLAAGLSGGEAQRVAVARALVRQPQLILADEPTGAQDKDFTWAVMELFARENRRGASIIVATHDLEIVRKFRRRAAVLRKGGLSLEENACTL